MLGNIIIIIIVITDDL